MLRLRNYCLAAIAAVFALSWHAAPISGQQEGPLELDGPEAPSALDELESELGYTELTRGPVHEAFAEQVSLDPQPGIIVAKEPPAPIDEVPPDAQPTGENVIWTDGYWAFSDDEDDFIWVSGAWRTAPRGYQWVPGYWNKVDAGYQWIGGFWATADRGEVEYLPTPPESLDEGPTSAAPGDDYFWIPGNWNYQDSRYAWRPGYWALAQANYVWIPHYYRWTPSGCILAGGYWDYPLLSRGYLFAPVYFDRPVYRTQGWYYTPRVALDLGPLHFHLFVRPSYSHYYFGDYYGDQYLNNGWFAWHNYSRHRHAYDPLFAFNVVRYRSRGIDFYDRSRRWHEHFRDHEDARPQHTFKKQKDFIAQHRDGDHLKTVALGDSFSDVVRNKRDKFVDLDDSRRSHVDDMRERFGKIRQQRTELEAAENQGRTSAAERGERGRAFPRLSLPGRETTGERDAIRALRPNLDDSGREKFEQGQRRDQVEQRDLTPRSQPPASVPDDARQRLQDRINEAQRQRQFDGPRQFDQRRREESAPTREEKPLSKPSPGGLIRPDTDPRGESRFGPSPDRSRFQPAPGSVRRGDNVPDNSRQGAGAKGGGDFRTQPPSRTVTPDLSPRSSTPSRSFSPRPDSGGNRPSFRAPSSSGNNPPARAVQRPPTRQSTPAPRPQFRSNSNRGAGGGGNFSRGNFNRGNFDSGNSGRGRGKKNK